MSLTPYNSLSEVLGSLQQSNIIITRYQLIPYKIKLKTPWYSATSTINFRQGFLIKLSINEFCSAIGECAPMIEIGTESLSQAQYFIEKKLPDLIGKEVSIDSLSDMDSFPACRFALETAFLSLVAQHKKKSIARLLNPDLHKTETIKVNAMLGCLNNDLIAHARQAEAQGYKCLKIKVGLDNIENEAKILEYLFQQLSTDTQIRLDANKSWTLKETQWLLEFLTAYDNQIDSIEEPLKTFNQAAYQTLQNGTSIALALDESFAMQINSLERINSLEQINSLEEYPVTRLVLKPMAQGGIINTLHLARQAQQSNIKTVITSSIETAHGLWPIVHLCAALNNQQFHGLATASWLQDTLIKPPEIKYGSITL